MSAQQTDERSPAPSGITFAEKASIDVPTAALFIELIDLTTRLLAKLRWPRLSDPVLAAKRDLEQFVTHANAYANRTNVRTEAISARHVLPSGSELVRPKDAAVELGIEPAGVRYHCTNNGLGRKVGSRWQIEREELNMFKATRGIA